MTVYLNVRLQSQKSHMKKKQSGRANRKQTAQSKYIVLMCRKYTDITNMDQITGQSYTIYILKNKEQKLILNKLFIRDVMYIIYLNLFRLLNSLTGFRRVFLALVKHQKVSAKFCQVNELKLYELKGMDLSKPCVDWFRSFFITCTNFI